MSAVNKVNHYAQERAAVIIQRAFRQRIGSTNASLSATATSQQDVLRDAISEVFSPHMGMILQDTPELLAQEEFRQVMLNNPVARRMLAVAQHLRDGPQNESRISELASLPFSEEFHQPKLQREPPEEIVSDEFDPEEYAEDERAREAEEHSEPKGDFEPTEAASGNPPKMTTDPSMIVVVELPVNDLRQVGIALVVLVSSFLPFAVSDLVTRLTVKVRKDTIVSACRSAFRFLRGRNHF